MVVEAAALGGAAFLGVVQDDDESTVLALCLGVVEAEAGRWFRVSSEYLSGAYLRPSRDIELALALRVLRILYF